MGRRPTIVDVAQKAGVSKSTVSLVLQRSRLVKESTRQSVQDAIKDLDYVYNRVAANLRGSRVGLIGLVINDLRNPFFAEFAMSVQMELAKQHYAVVLANTQEDPLTQTQVIGAMIEHGISGLVVSPCYGGRTVFDAPLKAGIPTMQVLRRIDQRTTRVPFAAPDYKDGIQKATEHLLALGSRQIAFVGGLEGWQVTNERVNAYRDCLARHGLKPLLLLGGADGAFGMETTKRLATEHPETDAVLCFNDRVALGMLAGYADAGRCVGRDIRIVGFDDIEGCTYAWPTLSSVSCDIAGFGRSIARDIAGWLENGNPPQPEKRSSVELVVRVSSQGHG